jgi:hypothetical protein
MKHNPRSQSDFNSVRSPSSLGMTQMTKLSNSQSSLKSAISMKESPSFPNAKSIAKDANHRYNEIDVKSDKSDKASVVSSSTHTNASSVRRDMSSSPVPRSRTPKSSKSSRTILDGGVPQTEV